METGLQEQDSHVIVVCGIAGGDPDCRREVAVGFQVLALFNVDEASVAIGSVQIFLLLDGLCKVVQSLRKIAYLEVHGSYVVLEHGPGWALIHSTVEMPECPGIISHVEVPTAQSSFLDGYIRSHRR